MNKEIEKYRLIFNKLIRPLAGVDLLDEYVKIRLKVSNLSASKRKAVLQHILIQYNRSEKVQELIDQLDQLIINELKNSYGE